MPQTLTSVAIVTPRHPWPYLALLAPVLASDESASVQSRCVCVDQLCGVGVTSLVTTVGVVACTNVCNGMAFPLSKLPYQLFVGAAMTIWLVVSKNSTY